MRGASRSLFAVGLALLTVTPAAAFDPSDFSNAAILLTEQGTKTLVKSIGFGGDYHSIAGANVPGGLIGLEVSLEIAVAKAPPEFQELLESAGYSEEVPGFVPAARLHFHKSFGDRLAGEVGFLKIRYDNYRMTSIAGSGKVVLITGEEEGPALAFRLSYTLNDYTLVTARTWTPQLVLGKRMMFAEPYLGIGAQFAKGIVGASVNAPSIGRITVENRASARSFIAYTGLLFHLPVLQLGFEGQYSSAGMPSLAMRLGMAF